MKFVSANTSTSIFALAANAARADFYDFLDASLHLYNRVCPSVGPSVHPSVGDAFVKIY